MDKKQFEQAIQEIRKTSKKRNFVQTFDIIINLKNLDLKKEDQKVNNFLALPYLRGKKVKVAALVGQELSTKAKDACEHVFLQEDFKGIDKKQVKKAASDTEFFVAQANIMPQVAQTFGKVLGPLGKMPNPKAGCIVPPTGDIKPVIERLQKTVHLQTKNELTVKAPIGNESMKDEEIIENALAVYNNILHSVPQEKNNIVSVVLKLTMGLPVYVAGQGKKKVTKEKAPEEKKIEIKEKPKEKKEEKETKQ